MYRILHISLPPARERPWLALWESWHRLRRCLRGYAAKRWDTLDLPAFAGPPPPEGEAGGFSLPANFSAKC